MNAVEGQAHYVEGALRLLQFVEVRRPTGRRFGADADARWGSFKGDLRTADRIELLIRDADAEWPGAFGARTVYNLRAVAEDDPFGAQWPELDPVEAEALWRRLKAEAPPTDPAAACAAVASSWGLTLRPHALASISPTDRLLLAGPSAIAATINAFVTGTALDWADQVIVFATPPAHRQLAAAATALVNGSRLSRHIAAADALPALPPGARLVVSDDADPRDRAHAEALLAKVGS